MRKNIYRILVGNLLKIVSLEDREGKMDSVEIVMRMGSGVASRRTSVSCYQRLVAVRRLKLRKSVSIFFFSVELSGLKWGQYRLMKHINTQSNCNFIVHFDYLTAESRVQAA
jgi:hypothetical protein